MFYLHGFVVEEDIEALLIADVLVLTVDHQ
jgi:hypothetical protein